MVITTVMRNITNRDGEITYLLKGIPLDIWERAKVKARAERPPIAMRWVLIQLLEKWAGPAPKDATHG